MAVNPLLLHTAGAALIIMQLQFSGRVTQSAVHSQPSAGLVQEVLSGSDVITVAQRVYSLVWRGGLGVRYPLYLFTITAGWCSVLGMLYCTSWRVEGDIISYRYVYVTTTADTAHSLFHILIRY